jgi:transcriptional regulator with XRE-family HTH domain
MFVDRVIEEKKRLNLSAKTMADTSSLRLSEDTVTRILAKKTNDPGVRTMESIAETVGLKPYELFMDAETAAEFRAYQEFKDKSNETEAERIIIVAENETLKATNAGLADRLRVLEMTTEHQKEKIALMEELLAMYRERK